MKDAVIDLFTSDQVIAMIFTPPITKIMTFVNDGFANVPNSMSGC